MSIHFTHGLKDGILVSLLLSAVDLFALTSQLPYVFLQAAWFYLAAAPREMVKNHSIFNGCALACSAAASFDQVAGLGSSAQNNRALVRFSTYQIDRGNAL